MKKKTSSRPDWKRPPKPRVSRFFDQLPKGVPSISPKNASNLEHVAASFFGQFFFSNLDPMRHERLNAFSRFAAESLFVEAAGTGSLGSIEFDSKGQPLLALKLHGVTVTYPLKQLLSALHFNPEHKSQAEVASVLAALDSITAALKAHSEARSSTTAFQVEVSDDLHAKLATAADVSPESVSRFPTILAQKLLFLIERSRTFVLPIKPPLTAAEWISRGIEANEIPFLDDAGWIEVRPSDPLLLPLDHRTFGLSPKAIVAMKGCGLSSVGDVVRAVRERRFQVIERQNVRFLGFHQLDVPDEGIAGFSDDKDLSVIREVYARCEKFA